MTARAPAGATLAAMIAIFAPGAGVAAEQGAEPGGGDGSYIVVYREDPGRSAQELTADARRAGIEVDYRYGAALDGYAATLTREQLAAVRADPDVAFVSANGVAEATATVPLADGEPLPPTGVRRIRAATRRTAREASTSNVAVLDTGIKLRHPDLNAVSGTDCIDPGTVARDEAGHGTHIAGTLAARNDGAGVVGVAPGTRLVSVRVLDQDGFGTFAQIICGIDWVTANHEARNIDVANMSLRGIVSGSVDAPCAQVTDALHKAICNSTDAGVTYVVAAGNDTSYYPDPRYLIVPASYPQVLTVTAMSDFDGRPGALADNTCTPYGSDDAMLGASNWSRDQDAQAMAHTIAAPGDCIASTWPWDPYYRVASGTSTAAPHVAGLAALCFGEIGSGPGRCAGMSPPEVIAQLRFDAARFAANHPGWGFWGAPEDPMATRYYGHLAAVARVGPSP